MARRYRPELKARDAIDRDMARLGLPSEFWHVLLKDFSFRITPFRKDRLSAVAQRKWCEHIVVDRPYAPFFVVGSHPTDRGAIALVTWMLRHRINYDRRIVYTNAALEFNYRLHPTTVGIHNVTQTATAQRCEDVRDIVVTYHTSFRVIAVATKTPEAWALNKLHLQPTAVFYLKDI